MKSYRIETLKGSLDIKCDSFQYDENYYLQIIVDNEITQIYSPEFWHSISFNGRIVDK